MKTFDWGLNEATVIAAMSVIPIAWLTANDIAEEMFLKEVNGRTIIPILKSLLKQKKIIQKQGNPLEYRLSNTMAKQAIRNFNKL